MGVCMGPSGRVCLGGCMYTYTCAYVWRPDSTMGAIPRLLSVFFLEMEYLFSSKLAVESRLAGQ